MNHKDDDVLPRCTGVCYWLGCVEKNCDSSLTKTDVAIIIGIVCGFVGIVFLLVICCYMHRMRSRMR